MMLASFSVVNAVFRLGTILDNAIIQEQFTFIRRRGAAA
jgi:hypothetical protein